MFEIMYQAYSWCPSSLALTFPLGAGEPMDASLAGGDVDPLPAEGVSTPVSTGGVTRDELHAASADEHPGALLCASHLAQTLSVILLCLALGVTVGTRTCAGTYSHSHLFAG